MDKNLSRAIAQRFRALRRVRGKDYSLVSVYESELKGALSILADLRLISIDEWDRLNSLASKFALLASGCGWHSVRQYNARRASRSSATSSVKVLQDEPASESVSAEPASPRLSVRGVLVGKAAPGAIQQPRRVRVQLVNFDGVLPDRLEFPRLGKHWAPSSLLVGNQERKGHSVLRA